MAIGNVWVFAQGKDGARDVGDARTADQGAQPGWRRDGVRRRRRRAASRRSSASTARSKVYATGDLGGALPGASAAAAMQAVIAGGDAPDLILFPQNYEGRDTMARLSVKLDKTVLTNNVDIAVDGDQVRGDDAGVRRQHAWSPPPSPVAVRSSPRSGRSRSRPSRPRRRRRARSWPRRCPISAPPARRGSWRRTSRSRPVRSSTRRTSSCRVAVASARPASSR